MIQVRRLGVENLGAGHLVVTDEETGVGVRSGGKRGCGPELLVHDGAELSPSNPPTSGS